MIKSTKEVLHAALQLPRKSRAALTQKLVKSLREPSVKGGKPMELTEGLRLVIERAEKDWQAFKRGEMKTYAHEEVMRSAPEETQAIMKTVTWFAPARADLNEAIDYFEQQAEGLGKLFLDKMEDAIETIQRFPYAAERLTRNFRICQLRKFRRYGILYKIGKQSIFVHRIVHLQRGPGFWKRVLR